MKLRVRKLHRSFDTQAFKDVRREHGYGQGRNQALGNVTASAMAAAETPVEVSTTDLDSDLEGVSAMLRAGELTVEDLVNDGSGWRSISDFYPLEDVFLSLGRRGRAGMPPEAVAKMVIGGLVGAAVLALAIWARLR